tara:strand:- start:53 stop:262 length:210 start_codon:yes stop_codon:yes gene_type:complete
VKKDYKETTLFKSETATNKDLETDKIKTTNVNILLNRVRLDRKKALKKRIVFSVFLAAIVSSFVIYFII